MAIPKEILAIPRPKNTRVKPSGNHYLVIKRTCKRINGENIPVELGTIGEIRDGRYIERSGTPARREIDIKDYGEIAVCDKHGKDLMGDLLEVWTPKEAKSLYTLLVYRAYAQRWEIEVFIDFFKNIIDRDCENVHNDYGVYATELVNFLSAIIASRVKKEFSRLGLYKHHSHKELMRYLSKYKKVRNVEDGKWKPCKKLAYIDDIISMLGI